MIDMCPGVPVLYDSFWISILQIMKYLILIKFDRFYIFKIIRIENLYIKYSKTAKLTSCKSIKIME